MNNSWNRLIYKFWSPVYDHLFNKGPFLKARKKVFSDLIITKGQRILFVGCGTGVDLEYIPLSGLDITAIDYSQDMLDQAKAKFTDKNITFLQMDAQALIFPDDSYDIVVASLLLSVVPNPQICMNEIIRVTKPMGQIIVFDKFVPINQQLSPLKKVVRPLIAILGTDIGIQFEQLVQPFRNSLNIQTNTAVMLKGMYRKIVAIKV